MTHIIPLSMKIIRASATTRCLLLCPRSSHKVAQVNLQNLQNYQASVHHLKSSVLQHLLPPGLPSTCTYCTQLNALTYEQVSNETLESLSEVLEELIESEAAPQDSDILYSSGVLTLSLGASGTYVINKQTPNKQVWLSSPLSGPKRFDFQDNTWIYKHTGDTLHGLLSQELSAVFGAPVNFSSCSFAPPSLE